MRAAVRLVTSMYSHNNVTWNESVKAQYYINAYEDFNTCKTFEKKIYWISSYFYLEIALF